MHDAGVAPPVGDGTGGGAHDLAAVETRLTVPPKADPPPLPASVRARIVPWLTMVQSVVAVSPSPLPDIVPVLVMVTVVA